jgi:hypothetical protein
VQSKHGEKTGELGHWLTNYLEVFGDYSVYYDHGDQQSSANVVKVKGFVGSEITRQTQLAQIDVMVAGINQEAVLLIELEESGFRPKRILGDIFSILMCNRLSVKENQRQTYFKITPQTKLIVAGIASTKTRIEDVIKPRLREFTAPFDSIRPHNVYIVWGSDLESTVDKLKEILRAEFLSGTSKKGRSQGCSVLENANIIKNVFYVHTIIEKRFANIFDIVFP